MLVGLPACQRAGAWAHLARNRKETTETDIVMTLTPADRAAPRRGEEDLRSFAVGGESSPCFSRCPPSQLARAARWSRRASSRIRRRRFPPRPFSRRHKTDERRTARPLPARAGAPARPGVPRLPRLLVGGAVIYLDSPGGLRTRALTPLFGFLDDALMLWLSIRWLVRSGPRRPTAPGARWWRRRPPLRP